MTRTTKHIGTLLLTLAAVLAMSIVGVTSAFAAPKFFNKTKELKAGETVTFTGSSPAGELKAPKGTITCTSNTSSGTINGQKVEKIVVTYKGCTSSFFECKSKGEAKEVIKTESIKGELVWLKKTAGAPAGLLLSPEAGATKEFTKEIECAGGIVKELVFGSIIGEIAKPALKTLSLTSELVFKENAGKTAQQWRQVEEAGAIHELEAEKSGSGKFDQLKDTENLTYSEEIKVE